MRVRDYAGPVGVLAAGAFGFSLLCSVSALAMDDLNEHSRARLEPPNIVELAVDNLGTSVGLTEQAVTAFVPTPTVIPSNTASLTPLPPDTATATLLPSYTPREPTRTRRPRPAATFMLRPPPTRTPPPPATNTPLPPTNTSAPPTNTSSPPTDTSPPPTEPPATDPPATEPPATDPPIQILNETSTASP